MIQEDINPYNPEEFEKYFEKTSLYKKISNDYNVISFDSCPDFYKHYTYRSVLSLSIFDASPLYYLQYLIDSNSLKIHDIGCASNIFKKYIPNIIGVDVPDAKYEFKDHNADIYVEIDNFFYEKYFEKIESAFSINSLHFYPISKIRDRVLQFSSLITKGGIGFISLNIARMVESELRLPSSKTFSPKKIKEIENFIRRQLFNLPFKIEVFECLLDKQFDSSLNGNVRIVFTKI
jgi:hypothetical protein